MVSARNDLYCVEWDVKPWYIYGQRLKAKSH